MRPAGLRVPEVLQLQVPHRRVHNLRRLFSRRDGGVLAPEGSPAGDGAHRVHRHERPALRRVRDVRHVMQHHHRRPRVPGVQAGHVGEGFDCVCVFHVAGGVLLDAVHVQGVEGRRLPRAGERRVRVCAWRHLRFVAVILPAAGLVVLVRLRHSDGDF